MAIPQTSNDIVVARDLPRNFVKGKGGFAHFNTITEALRHAAPNTTIRVFPGLYRENIVIKIQGITIEGVAGQGSKLLASVVLCPADFSLPIIQIAAPDCVLRHLRLQSYQIRGPTKGDEIQETRRHRELQAQIEVWECNAIIEDCKFHTSHLLCVKLCHGSKGSSIRDCSFLGDMSNNAINIESNSHLWVDHCHFSYFAKAIYGKQADYLTLDNSAFLGCQICLDIHSADMCEVQNCIFKHTRGNGCIFDETTLVFSRNKVLQNMEMAS